MKSKIAVLVGAVLVLSCFMLFYKLDGNWGYIFERRSYKTATLIIVGLAVGVSSLMFQTLTQNKILTPAVMGFESVYLLLQTLIVFIYGDKTFHVVSESQNFYISVLAMLGFALLLFYVVFKKENNNMYFLLLVGLVLGTLFGTLSSFLQMVVDPNEFSMVETRMFATFSNANTDLFWPATILLLGGIIGTIPFVKRLDVLLLGKENAISLGVPYDRTVVFVLFLVSVLVAVSTALVGPITFLGVLVANLTYELFKTHKHSILLLACGLISCVVLLLSQFIVEKLFNHTTTVSIIVNFVGGVYFLFILLKKK